MPRFCALENQFPCQNDFCAWRANRFDMQTFALPYTKVLCGACSMFKKELGMLNHSMKNLVLGAALALAAGATLAQSTTTPANNIGVTPQSANEATQKAVPQADTGTVVRTAPSAATRAEEAAKDIGNAVTPNTRATAPAAGSTAARTDATGSTSAGSSAGSTASNSANDNSTLASSNTNRNARPLRADRN